MNMNMNMSCMEQLVLSIIRRIEHGAQKNERENKSLSIKMKNKN